MSSEAKIIKRCIKISDYKGYTSRLEPMEPALIYGDSFDEIRESDEFKRALKSRKRMSMINCGYMDNKNNFLNSEEAEIVAGLAEQLKFSDGSIVPAGYVRDAIKKLEDPRVLYVNIPNSNMFEDAYCLAGYAFGKGLSDDFVI